MGKPDPTSGEDIGRRIEMSKIKIYLAHLINLIQNNILIILSLFIFTFFLMLLKFGTVKQPEWLEKIQMQVGQKEKNKELEGYMVGKFFIKASLINIADIANQEYPAQLIGLSELNGELTISNPGSGVFKINQNVDISKRKTSVYVDSKGDKYGLNDSYKMMVEIRLEGMARKFMPNASNDLLATFLPGSVYVNNYDLYAFNESRKEGDESDKWSKSSDDAKCVCFMNSKKIKSTFINNEICLPKSDKNKCQINFEIVTERKVPHSQYKEGLENISKIKLALNGKISKKEFNDNEFKRIDSEN